MILAVDIGNSAVKFGLFQGDRLLKAWRIPHGHRLPRLPRGMVRVAVSSVNPAALRKILPQLKAPVRMAGRDFRIPLKGAGRGTGTDRLLAAYAAWKRVRGPVAVIDVGTAMTLTLVDAQGRFLGGAIFAGPETARATLARRASGLPMGWLSPSTRAALRSGEALAYRGFVREGIAEATKRLGRNPKVFLTGGGGRILSERLSLPYRPYLVLEGLAASEA